MGTRTRITPGRYHVPSGQRRRAHAPSLSAAPVGGTFANAMRAPVQTISALGPLGSGTAAEIARLFAPDAPMPAVEPRRYDPGASPERRLMLAVLRNAIHDVSTPATGLRATAMRDAARDWIASDATRWPFAFVPLCDALGFESATLREGILAPRRPISLHALAIIDAPLGSPLGARNNAAWRDAGSRCVG